MPKRFAAVEHAAENGFEKTTPTAGAKLVGDWAKELEAIDLPGAKGLHGDLIQLERELGKDTADVARVKGLLGKIGSATIKLAEKGDDEKVAMKVRSLGEALSKAA